MPSFADLGVPDDLCDALDSRAIAAPFPIQEATIPAALEGRDVCGRAPTGSGKTLAFGVPLVARVQRARPKRPRALVLVPTRELAAQVCRDLEWLGASRDVRAHAFYGGTRIEPQIKALRRGVDIAVACPGRLADLVNQGLLRLDGVDLVVIDEADRMADMGFLPEVRRLVDQTAPERQTWLFSATLDGDVDELIRRYQNDPIQREVEPPESDAVVPQYWWRVPHPDRVATTADVVRHMGPTIVFTRTRHGADRVARQLERAGVRCAAIHGNRTQKQRDRALSEFRAERVDALVATDVAARGIHVDDVACVVHFDLPADPKDFVHRSGRTGRAGSDGVVVALVMPDKQRDAAKLARQLDVDADFSPVDLDALPAAAPVRPQPRRPGAAGGHSEGRAHTDRSGPRSGRHAGRRPGKSKPGPKRGPSAKAGRGPKAKPKNRAKNAPGAPRRKKAGSSKSGGHPRNRTRSSGPTR